MLQRVFYFLYVERYCRGPCISWAGFDLLVCRAGRQSQQLCILCAVCIEFSCFLICEWDRAFAEMNAGWVFYYIIILLALSCFLF